MVGCKYWLLTLNRVAPRRHHSAFACPVSVEKLSTRLIKSFVGMRAKIVALCLQQIRRQPLTAVRIVKCQRGAKGWNRDAFLRGDGDDITPGPLRILDRFPEERIQQ